MQMADYLAPELMHPGRAPDPLTDIYALGCTLYAMLAGNPPFAGGSLQQKMARHAGEAIRPLELFGVPQPLAQLVAYLMAKNPAVRYQSAALVAEQLAAFVDPAALYRPAAAAARDAGQLRALHSPEAGSPGGATRRERLLRRSSSKPCRRPPTRCRSALTAIT